MQRVCSKKTTSACLCQRTAWVWEIKWLFQYAAVDSYRVELQMKQLTSRAITTCLDKSVDQGVQGHGIHCFICNEFIPSLDKHSWWDGNSMGWWIVIISAVAFVIQKWTLASSLCFEGFKSVTDFRVVLHISIYFLGFGPSILCYLFFIRFVFSSQGFFTPGMHRALLEKSLTMILNLNINKTLSWKTKTSRMDFHAQLQ